MLHVRHNAADELRERLVDLVFEALLARHLSRREVVHLHLEEGGVGREERHQEFGGDVVEATGTEALLGRGEDGGPRRARVGQDARDRQLAH